MEGKIYFKDIRELAVFLKEFTGSTAMFKAYETLNGNSTQWVLEFTGGF